MKKIFLYLLVIGVTMASCRKDDPNPNTDVEVDATTQNGYDDEAITKFLQDNYFDEKGNVKGFNGDIKPDSTHVKLADLQPVKLPSGVVFIKREGAQPTAGKTIGATDSIKIMINAVSFKATNDNNNIALRSPATFQNTIMGSGIPMVDPAFYYVKQNVLDAATTEVAKQRSYYEIEGFREALQLFTSFDMQDSDNYNLQGVILVPSRAAFGKEPHFNYTGFSLKDRSFVINFQMYNTYTRVVP